MPTAAGFALGSFLLGLPFTAITYFALQEVRRLRPHHVAATTGLVTALWSIGQTAGPPMVAVLLRRTTGVGAAFTLLAGRSPPARSSSARPSSSRRRGSGRGARRAEGSRGTWLARKAGSADDTMAAPSSLEALPTRNDAGAPAAAEAEQSLPDALQQTLDEARMVLPGLQALFGFQLIAVFSDGFERRLDATEQSLHLAAIVLVTIAIAIVMTPAAYHRQVEPRSATARSSCSPRASSAARCCRWRRGWRSTCPSSPASSPARRRSLP